MSPLAPPARQPRWGPLGVQQGAEKLEFTTEGANPAFLVGRAHPEQYVTDETRESDALVEAIRRAIRGSRAKA